MNAEGGNDGWIESVDPTTGRTFYANHVTRTTQWDPPPGWKINSSATAAKRSMAVSKNNNGKIDTTTTDDDDALPDGWEEMSDPTTGRKFYVDHSTKATTWDRPRREDRKNNRVIDDDTANSNDLFGLSAMQLNQHGSHGKWDDTDPRIGSRPIISSQMMSHSPLGGPPPLDFIVVSVPDSMRTSCPSCNSTFTYTKRRHHCRLCGDIFCDACSSTRAVLPLDGKEYDVPVRVCDTCMKDVKRGNYFSLRRYLTPLQLFDPTKKNKPPTTTTAATSAASPKDDSGGSGEVTREITAMTVAASLSSLSADIDAMIQDPSTYGEKMTISAHVLIPAVGKHLHDKNTAEYAVRVISGLLTLGSVAGDDSYALAVYGVGGGEDERSKKRSSKSKQRSSIAASTRSTASSTASNDGSDDEDEDKTPSSGGVGAVTKWKPSVIVNDILAILEWNGTDSRSLSALEEATKVVYYITDPNFVESAISKLSRQEDKKSSPSSSEEEKKGNDENTGGPIDVDEVVELARNYLRLDTHRAFRAMLDHATSSVSSSLQRWSTASLRHLIAEDRRRACSASSSKYESFMNQLVSTGGIMILCSLLSSDEEDTRTHAASSLEAVVISTRAIGLMTAAATTTMKNKKKKKKKKSRFIRVGRGTDDDSAIVDAIVSNGGCGPALAHLLISADESVSRLGFSFANSLISPLLSDPRGSGQSLRRCISGYSEGTEVVNDGLSSYRHAAITLVVPDTGEMSCLPSLIQVLRSGAEESWGGKKTARSLQLQVVAGECLAAIALAIGHIVSTGSGPLYAKAMKALEIMENERIFDISYKLATSASSRSLDPSRNTPQARLREASGLSLLALSSCSSITSSYLVSNNAVSELLSIASEMLSAPSALRGAWASRGLCYLECATELLLNAWKSSDTSCLNLLLEALGAGAVGLASRIVKTKVHLSNHDNAYSQMRIKIACCYMLSAMFGIAVSNDENALGTTRLGSAVDADCAASLAYADETEGRTDLVASSVFLLSATLPYAQQFANDDVDEPLPMSDLCEACMLAIGSMCGGNDSVETHISTHSHLRIDASELVCRAMTSGRSPLLSSVLIGALGENLVNPALRLTLAIALNGPIELRGELARSGMLVPLGDIVQHSLSSGERHKFSVAVAIVRLCGPFTNSEARSGNIGSLQNVIRTMSVALTISESGQDRSSDLLALKFECLFAMEALSANEILQSTMMTEAIPAVIQLLTQLVEEDLSRMDVDGIICSALKTIKSLISLPSASSLAVNDVISSIVKILNNSHDETPRSQMQRTCIELLLDIAFGKSSVARNGGFLFSGVFESVVSLFDGAGSNVHRILEIIDFIIQDIDGSSPLLRNDMLRQFSSVITRQDQFLRSLIATMLATEESNQGTTILPSLYGSPIHFYDDADLQLATNNAIKLLFSILSLLCSDETGIGKQHLTHLFMLKNVRGWAKTATFTCSYFIHLLKDETDGVCVPQNLVHRESFVRDKLPVVRCLLLEVLSLSLDDCLSSDSSREHAEKLICDFKIPQLCLSFCQLKTVSQVAFDLFENVVLPLPIDKLGDLLLNDKSSLITIFDLVTGQNNLVPDLEHSKEVFAITLGNLAKSGLLAVAVEKFSVRNNAIAALCATIQGTDAGIIDESMNSLPRICLESLCTIFCSDKGDNAGVNITALEARAIASAIGKILSTTLLNRFFTQASLETALDDSIDHSSDRSLISQSAEATLLCSLASFPESLNVLHQIGGFEAIGLIAHEGELTAILAIKNACELSPKSVVDCDAHISIMEAFIHVERLLAADPSNLSRLRDVAISCMQVIHTLSQNPISRWAIHSAEQSFGCLSAAVSIISASSEVLNLMNKDTTSVSKNVTESNEKPVDRLQVGDLVYADMIPSSKRSKGGSKIDKLQGKVAYIGPVKFKPGDNDDWIGIQLTGESAGQGKCDGSVQGVRYFDCDGRKKDGIFVKKDNVVKKQGNQVLLEVVSPEIAEEGTVWHPLLLKNDLTLERAAFSLLLSLSTSKPHRDAMMQNVNLVDNLTNMIENSSAVIGYRINALELLVSLTRHMSKKDDKLPPLLYLLVESQMKALQVTRDNREQMERKQLICMAINGLQNLFGSFMDLDEQSRTMKITSDLFIYLTDSLYTGPKSKRVAVSIEDGHLFYQLSSFFIYSLGGTESVVASILSAKFISSVIRFVMMTASVPSFDRNIPIAAEMKLAGGEHWNAALVHCLFYLSCNMTQSSQEHIKMSYERLIADVEPSPNYFQFCLEHITKEKVVASVAARNILTNLY